MGFRVPAFIAHSLSSFDRAILRQQHQNAAEPVRVLRVSRLAQPCLDDDKFEQTRSLLIANPWMGHYGAPGREVFRLLP